jgi:serine/threonine protein kinase
LESELKGYSFSCREIIKRMLEPNLALRPLAAEALIHPWFKDQNEPV